MSGTTTWTALGIPKISGEEPEVRIIKCKVDNKFYAIKKNAKGNFYREEIIDE